jgi:hypothetical protein
VQQHGAGVALGDRGVEPAAIDPLAGLDGQRDRKGVVRS